MKIALVGSSQPAYRTQSQDGTAHFSYYLADRQLSFVWSGIPRLPVEVEFGGYGEPLVAVVFIEESDLPDDNDRSPLSFLKWFEHFCDQINYNLGAIHP